MGKMFPKQVYIRVFLLFAVVSILIMVPFSLLLINQFSQHAYNEITGFTQDKLYQTVDNTEFILNNLKSYGMNMYQDKDIRDWLFSDSKDELQDVAALTSVLKYLSTEPFIRQVYLFNMERREVMDSRLGLLSFDRFTDKAMLSRIEDNKPRLLNYFEHGNDQGSFLAMIVPARFTENPEMGYLVMLLDKAVLQKYLLRNSQDADINIVIIDYRGSLVLGSLEEEALKQLPGYIGNSKKGNFSFNSREGKVFVNYSSMNTQQWIICNLSRLEMLRTKAEDFERYIITLSVIALAILLAVIFWNSRKVYKPFSTLADDLQKTFSDQQQEKKSVLGLHEYGVISRGIEYLKENVNKLNSTIRNHRALIKEEYLRQWILQGKLGESVKENLGQMTRLFSFHHLHIAVMRIESFASFSEENNFSSRKLLKFGMANIAEELISNNGWTGECADMGGDHIVVIIEKGDESLASLSVTLDTIKGKILELLGIRVTVAVSDVRSVRDDLRHVYDHIYELTMLKFIWGVDKIYREEDYEKYIQMVDQFPDESILDELIQAIRLGNREKVKDLLEKLFQQMHTMTYTQCKFLLTTSIYTIVKAFKNWTTFKDFEGIQTLLDRFDTLAEVRQWLEEEISSVMNNLCSRKGNNRKDEIVQDILEYIDNHIHDPMLSANDIAEHISMSESYVRQLFREVFDTTVSEYILSTRVSMVKRLLETTDLPVADISERSGFMTKSHFFTTFKKETGMTPKQYREANNMR